VTSWNKVRGARKEIFFLEKSKRDRIGGVAMLDVNKISSSFYRFDDASKMS
jgi:hypothetical protein